MAFDAVKSFLSNAGASLESGGGITGTGKMAKAALQVVDTNWRGGFQTLKFMYNPETVQLTKQVEFKEHQVQGGDSGQKEWTHGVSRKLKVSKIYFDTYERKENVRTAYIDKLERLIHYDEELHRPPRLVFVWGQFMAENDDYNSCQWYLKQVDITYTLFLADGTPVRAEVQMELIEATSVKEQLTKKPKSSPDHAKVYTVQRGDTLQHIAWKEYDDPSEWRRIAEANGIDDPLSLKPGTKLLVPPILK